MSNCPVQGWQGYVGFGTQDVAIDTPVSPQIFQEIQPDEGLNEAEGDKAVISGGVRASQDFVAVRRGKKTVEGGSGTGNIWGDDFYQSKVWGCLLGNNQTVSGDATTGYTHEFLEPTAESQMSQFGQTIEILRGGESTVGVANENLWQYIGCFISTLNIASPENDLITVVPEWMGIKEAYNAIPTVPPTFSTVPPMESWQAVVKIGNTVATAIQIPYIDFTFTADSKIKMTPDGSSQYAACRVFGKPEYSLQLNQEATKTLATGLYQNWKNNDELAVVIELTSDTLAGSASGFYSVQIELPRVSITGNTPNLSAIEDFPLSVNFIALTDETAGYKIKVTTVDSVAGLYAV